MLLSILFIFGPKLTKNEQEVQI